MAWEPQPKGYNEFMTLGPYRFPHERDAACNKLCRTGLWHMHSSDICRRTGGYLCVMARWVDTEDA